MAIFGYIIYICCTLYVTLITLAVFSWPSARKWVGERTFVTVVFSLFWTGAVYWWPFTVTVS